MPHKNSIYIFLAFVFIFTNCQEVFEPDDLSSNERIIVINGRLTDIAQSVIVTINYTQAFGNDNYERINTAQVWLKDELGNSYQFEKTIEDGEYSFLTSNLDISEELKYFIHVETNNGDIFESTPQSFPGEIIIEDINAKIEKKEFSSKNDAGEVITSLYDGLSLNISLKSKDANKKYIRFADTAIYQSQYSYFSPSVVNKCVSYHTISTIPVIETTINNNGSEEIDHREIGFLRYINDTDYQNENSTARVSDSWVLLSKVYSLNKECYNYYNRIINQVSAQQKIFDPAPTQIFGNIKCISDSNLPSLGFFEVSRETRSYVAFNWSEEMDDFKKIKLESYNAPRSSFCTDFVSGFDWITFN